MDAKLPEKDINYIKQKIFRKVFAELSIRISKGYENIDLELVEPTIDKMLEESNILFS